MNITPIQVQDTLDSFDYASGALYSVSHLLEIVDNTSDQISNYHLSNLLRLVGDGLQYRLNQAKAELTR